MLFVKLFDGANRNRGIDELMFAKHGNFIFLSVVGKDLSVKIASQKLRFFANDDVCFAVLFLPSFIS